MRALWIPLIAGTLVTTVPARPAAAAAATSAATNAAFHLAPRERRGRVEIDASGLGPAADVTAQKIGERIDAVFTRGGVTETSDEGDPVLRLVIVPLEGDTVGYHITYEVRVDGTVVDKSSGVSDCRLCTEDELADLAEEAIERSVEHMEIETTPEPAADDPDVGTPGSVTTAGTTDTEPHRGSLTVLGKTGIALLVVGGVGIITGVGLVVPKPKPSPDRPTFLFSTRLPGYAVLGVGGAAAIAGAVMLGIDVRQSKRQTAAAGRRRMVRAAPMWGEATGVSLTGRF